MKIHLLCFVVLLSVWKSSAQLNCLTANDNRLPNPNGKQGLYTGQQGFSLRMLQAINKLNPDENLFFSPYSTYHALLLGYFISNGQTERYLKKALGLDANQDKADVFSAYKLDKLATELRALNKTYTFTNANRIYVASQVQVRECIPNIFQQELQRVDFQADAEGARQSINNWVENRTHGMIQDLLPPGTIAADTNLVLANAAYFKGAWENKFDPDHTKQELFYITPSKKTFVDMMHTEGTFNHEISEALMAHILELPYNGNDISMYILLPPFAKEDGIQNILKRLTLEKFKSIVEENTLLPRTVQVSLPKFSLEHTLELVPILDSLGVGNLFREDADFSVLTKARVSLGGGIHKAKIEVDEEGSKAAAATALFGFRMFNEENQVLQEIGVGDLFSDSANFTTLTLDNKVSVGNGIHKARIEVTEEGTKAAAATVLFTFRSSRPVEPAIFNCNHPFIYLIYDKSEQAILFNGVFRRPF